MSNPPDPAEALASIRDARSKVGRNLEYPFFWDVVYGGILALMVGRAGLPQPWSVLTLVISMGALVAMMQAWKARFGWWINGYGPPRARSVTIGMAAILLGLMGLSFWTRFREGPVWAPLLAAGLAAVVGVIAGRLWMYVFRKEMEGPGA